MTVAVGAHHLTLGHFKPQPNQRVGTNPIAGRELFVSRNVVEIQRLWILAISAIRAAVGEFELGQGRV